MWISCVGSRLQLRAVSKAAMSSGPEIQTKANEDSQPGVQQWANHRHFRALPWERVTPRRAVKGTAVTGAPLTALGGVVPLISRA